MPPKRKSGNGKGTPKKSKKAKRDSSPENESGGEEREFDKDTLQRCVKFDFEELMADPTFQHPEFIHTMEPEDLTLEWYEKNGLENPIHFRCDPKRIGMKLPPQTFSVNDVLELVGGNRMIEVVQVEDQGSVKMSLQEFVEFYNTPPTERKNLYNVLSLEYSLTPLEDLVDSPALVRQIDWVGNKWPDALRQRWISFNGREKKSYFPHHTFPKVQNYCLMSVANCYTDFHIDFSGTSVWYHVLKGRKVFWLIPPTPTNFFIYQEFIKTVSDNAFFGRSVEACHVAVLEPGDTMLIPAGWIHAVYTPEDSLVFGGNFLHSLSCQTQLRVYQVENKLNITRKFRLPYNEELLFYVIADYVKKWTGREYVRPLHPEDSKLDYVGEKWKAAGGHLKKIKFEDYNVEVTDEMVKKEEDSEKDEVKVIAMHAESSSYGNAMISKLSYTDVTGLEEEADEDEDYKPETKEEAAARRDEEIDRLAATNSLIFYKNSKHDFLRNKSVPDHKLPIGHEPPVYFNDEEVSRISPRLLEELEALGAYIRKKGRVEVAEGICQPASLIHLFNTVLKKRRAELTGVPFEFQQVMPRRYTRAALENGDYDFEPVRSTTTTTAAEDEAEKRRRSTFIVEDFPDEFLETDEPEVTLPQQPESGPLVYVPTPRDDYREDSLGFEKEDDEEDAYDPAPQKEEEPEEEEEEEYVAPVTRRSRARKSVVEEKKGEEKVEEKEEEEIDEMADEAPKKKEKAPKKEKTPKSEEKSTAKKLEREKKKKEQERRQLESQLDAELRAAHGAKSKKKKPEKPAYVGGLPTAPIQSDPVVSNPYNYDPRTEMMKLGTGQLKSAYRKTKANVELHFEKNLYKLEPKRGSHEGSESREQSLEPEHSPAGAAAAPYDRYSHYHTEESQFDHEHQRPPAKRAKYDTISVDTHDTPQSSKKRSLDSSRSSVISPNGSHHQNRPKLSSPAIFSPSQKPESNERRTSDPAVSTMAAKKGVYMHTMSRQDKMIADANSTLSSRHNSMSVSERRPSFIPDLSSASRHASLDAPYTPTLPTPVRVSSWLPNTSTINRHSLEDDDHPIDVVNDSMSPIDVINSPPFPRAVTPPPVSLRELANGKKKKNHDDGKKKIPSKDAVAELKSLVGKLKAINDA